MNYERQRGFTLVELLITLAIVAIALRFAAPPLAEFYRKQQLESYESELMRFIARSRHHALVNVSRVTTCALDAQSRCVSLKAGTLTSFVDSNNNRILDADEVALYTMPIPGHVRVSWNRSTPYLHFNGRGVNGFNA